MELIQSERKRDKMIDGGFMYIVDKKKSCKNSNIVYWRCESYRRKMFKCPARLHTKDGRIVKHISQHSHQANLPRMEALKIVQEIKDKATSTPKGTREIIEAAKTNISAEVAAYLPSNAALCRTLQRERQRAMIMGSELPPLPIKLPQMSSGPADDPNSLKTEKEDRFDDLYGHAEEFDDIQDSHEHSNDEFAELENSRDEVEQKPEAFQGPVFELRTVSFSTRGMRDYRQRTKNDDFVAIRAAFSDTVLGHWVTEGHGVNEVVQLVKYDNLEALLQVRQEMLQNQKWQEEIQSLEDRSLSAENVILILAPCSSLCSEFRLLTTAVYELQTFPEQSDQFPALGSEAMLVAHFHTLYGLARTEYRLLRYPNAASAFSGAFHTKYVLPLGSSNRLMIPLPGSSLH